MPRSKRPDAKKQKKQTASSASGLGCLLLLLFMGWVGLSGDDDDDKKESQSKQHRPSTQVEDDGRVAFIRGNVLVTRKSTPVASSEEAFDAWMKSGQAKDSLGLAGLMGAGLLSTLPAGSKVRVLDRSVWSGWVQLRVESGNLLGSSAYAVASEADFDWYSDKPPASERRKTTLLESADALPAGPAIGEGVGQSNNNYSVGVEAAVLDDGHVRIKATTNIPGTVEVMAVLALSGQDPEDTFVGTDERLTLRDGAGEIVLDTSTLPTGNYDAEVNFYPRWGLVDDRSKQSGANAELQARAPIAIVGSGEPVADVIARDAAQQWVMDNVEMGRKWNPDEWKRFGEPENVALTRHNPAVVKGYYYPSIDMTILVNTLKGEVKVWRLGRATE